MLFNYKLDPWQLVYCRMMLTPLFCAQQYWAGPAEVYQFISAAEMAAAFQQSPLGKAQAAELAQPPQRTEEGAVPAGAHCRLRPDTTYFRPHRHAVVH